MWAFAGMDDFEGHRDRVGADHAVALDLRGAAGTDVFHVGLGDKAESGGVEARAGADGAFEQRGLVTGGFDFAGGADFAGLENHRPSGDGGEEFFGQLDHGDVLTSGGRSDDRILMVAREQFSLMLAERA